MRQKIKSKEKPEPKPKNRTERSRKKNETKTRIKFKRKRKLFAEKAQAKKEVFHAEWKRGKWQSVTLAPLLSQSPDPAGHGMPNLVTLNSPRTIHPRGGRGGGGSRRAKGPAEGGHRRHFDLFMPTPSGGQLWTIVVCVWMREYAYRHSARK